MTAFLKFLILTILLLGVTGCGNGNLVSVSGTVTHDGQPVEGVLVIFSPQVQGDNHFPGPISIGKTDSNGKYFLKAKGGASGAAVGVHSVGFTWADVSSMEISVMESEYVAAASAGVSQSELSELKSRIAEKKERIRSRPQGIGMINESCEVPSNGTDAADFELFRQTK